MATTKTPTRMVVAANVARLIDEHADIEDVKALATVTGISYSTLRRRMSGTQPWTTDELDWVAEALGVSVDDLRASVAPTVLLPGNEVA